MKESWTLQFNDAETSDSVVLILRKVDDRVGICLSVESNGDAEAFMQRADAERLVSALKEALASHS